MPKIPEKVRKKCEKSAKKVPKSPEKVRIRAQNTHDLPTTSPGPPFRPRPHSSRGVFGGSSAPQGGGAFVGLEGRRTPHALPHISDFQPRIPPISTHTPQIGPQIRGFGTRKAHFGHLSNTAGTPEMPISAPRQAPWRAKRAKRANRTVHRRCRRLNVRNGLKCPHLC